MDIDYQFWFWMLIAFLIGKASHRPFFYIGDNIDDYRNAWIGIYFKRH